MTKEKRAITRVVRDPKKRRCYHERNSWLIAGGFWTWCYRCGAIQKNRHCDGNAVTPDGPWVKPTGPNGKNPA
jgi:hypothetical protein